MKITIRPLTVQARNTGYPLGGPHKLLEVNAKGRTTPAFRVYKIAK